MATTTHKVAIEFEGDSASVEAALKRVSGATDKMGARSKAAGKKAETAGKKVDKIAKKRATDNIKKADAALKGMIGAVGGLFVIGQVTQLINQAADAMGRLTKQTIATGDQFDKLAARTGVLPETLSTLAFAAERSGASLEDVTNGMRRFLRQQDAVRLGNEKAIGLFKDLGINAQDALLPIDQLMPRIAEGFKNLGTESQQTAVAFELFTESGPRLIPLLKGGAEGFRAMTDEARFFGAELSSGFTQRSADAADQMTNLSTATAALGRSFIDPLLPALTAATNQLATFIAEVNKSQRVPALAESLSIGFGEFLAELELANDVLNAVLETLGNQSLAGDSFLKVAADDATTLEERLTLAAQAALVLAATPIAPGLGVSAAARLGRVVERTAGIAETRRGDALVESTARRFGFQTQAQEEAALFKAAEDQLKAAERQRVVAETFAATVEEFRRATLERDIEAGIAPGPLQRGQGGGDVRGVRLPLPGEVISTGPLEDIPGRLPRGSAEVREVQLAAEDVGRGVTTASDKLKTMGLVFVDFAQLMTGLTGRVDSTFVRIANVIGGTIKLLERLAEANANRDSGDGGGGDSGSGFIDTLKDIQDATNLAIDIIEIATANGAITSRAGAVGVGAVGVGAVSRVGAADVVGSVGVMSARGSAARLVGNRIEVEIMQGSGLSKSLAGTQQTTVVVNAMDARSFSQWADQPEVEEALERAERMGGSGGIR